MKIPGKQPIKTIVKKLPQLDSEQKKAISDVVNNTSSNNIVSLDTKEILYKKSNKTFSVKFLNYVEPYLIKGQRYTLFYTDIDHNLRIGDRIFIVGGNYDSDVLIQNNKFSKLSDGYTVQYVDKTKVVLDIEYTGVLPWIEEDIDTFIKVYVASNQEEFDYFIQTVSQESFNYLTNRFAYSGTYSNNNILYINGTVSVNGSDYGIFGFTNSGSYSLTYSNSFLILDGTFSGYLQDITSDILNGSYSSYTNNDKIFIMNNDFDIQSNKFKKNYFYYFDQNWKVDRTYLQPFISEQNFRNGVFKKGEFNQGLFGTHQETINYSGLDVNFTLGTVLNTVWHSGNIGSGEGNEQSYFTSFDEFGLPSVKENTKNNAGLGYNFFYDSTIYSSIIENGTFDNNRIGTFSSDLILENHLLSNNSTYSVSIKSGNYFNNIIENSSILNSSLFTSLVKNSFVNNSRSGNSEFEKTVFLSSKYTTDKVVKIRAYDELFINWYDDSTVERYKMYKFYIDVPSYNRIKHFKNFYLDGIKIDKSGLGVLNFFDDKYTIDSYHSSYDEITGKVLRKYIVQLSTVEENKKIVSGLDNILIDNPNYGFASIDLIVKSYEDFNNQIVPFPLDIYNFDISSIESESSWGASPSSIIFEINTGTFSVDGVTSSENLYSGLSLLNYGTWTYSGSLFTVNSTFSYVELTYYNPITEINVGPIVASQLSTVTFSQIGNIVDISSAYILDSDFKSGLFKSSEWITGNNISYNIDNSFESVSGYPSTLDSNRNLSITTPNAARKLLLDTGDIAFLNGMYYDTSLNGGENLVKLPDTFKINNISSGSIRTFVLSDFINGTSSILWNVPTYIGQSYLNTKNAENAYNYIHSVKFESSKIKSGIFRRSYFVDCDINNILFNLAEKDPKNFNNWRSLLLSDVLFSDNNNKINSGVIANSSFIAGSDIWNNGIFYNSIWNTDSFTWSTAATSSEINTTFANKFKNGIFKESRWVNGIFENGNFYKNRSNIVFTASVYSDLTNAYYREKTGTDGLTRYAWLNGTFENGIFEQSNFEFGSFKNGEFYNSTFLNGIATGGDFGRRNVKFPLTRVASGTFSNVNVVSAEFRSENPTGAISGNIQINWLSGIFNNGLFGVKVDSASYSTSGLSYSIMSNWYDGTFNNGEFTDIASWKGGKFFGGKFTSYYGYPFVTAEDYSSAGSSSFAWQDGEFNGGEFGNASTGTNSTWYSGEFNGGLFRGRYWNDGIFTKGVFIGSGTSSTSLSNIPIYITGFSNEFFGLWNNGIVSENKDTFVKNKKIFTKLEREFNRKKKNRTVKLDNVYWRSGTFSHSDGLMNNSVWTGGAFEKGRFKNSSFNPYVDYLVNSSFTLNRDSQISGGSLDYWNIEYSDYSNDDVIGGVLFQQSDTTSDFAKKLEFIGTSSISTIYQQSGLIIGETYKLSLVLNSNFNNEIRFGDWTTPLRNRNFTEGYENWIIAATSQSGGPLPTLDIATGSPGYATFSDSTADGSAYIIYPNVFEVGRDYDIKFYSFNVSNMDSIQIGSCDSSQVQIENGILLSPFIDGVNLTYSSPALAGFLSNFESSRQITAEYTDFILNWSSLNPNSSFSINGFIITSNTVLTNSDISNRTTYNYTFNAQGSEFAIEFIPKTIASTVGASWSGSTSSIRSIELVKGSSGFNTSDSCYWDNGTFDDSEFYFSKWNNGKWITGTAMGMIWRNGVADYMNAYNIYWEGGVWRNGNWNGAPFTVDNISPDACLYSYNNIAFGILAVLWGSYNLGVDINISTFTGGFTVSCTPNTALDYRDSDLDPTGSGNFVDLNGLPFVTVIPSSTLTSGNNYRITLNIGTVSIANFDDFSLSNTPGSVQFSIGKPGPSYAGSISGSIRPQFVNIADAESNISNYYNLSEIFDGSISTGPISGTPSYIISGGAITETLTAADDLNLYIHMNLYGIYEFYVDSIIIEEEICQQVSAVNEGFASDILTNISVYKNSIADNTYQEIFINNAFTVSSTGIIPGAPDIAQNTFTYSGSSTTRWNYDTTYRYSSEFFPNCGRWGKLLSINDTNFYTESLNTSSKLYAVDINNPNNRDIFTMSGTYEISISFLCTYGPTTSPPIVNGQFVNSKEVDLKIFVGYSDNVIGNGGFVHSETVDIRVGGIGSCTTNPVSQYWGQSEVITRNFTFEPLGFAPFPGTPQTVDSFRFAVQMLASSDNGARLIVNSLTINNITSQYDDVYNNATYSMMDVTPQFGDTLILPDVDFVGGSSNGNLISIHFGNGEFKSGTASSYSSIWENGVWNEGFRYDRNVVAFDNLAIFSGTNKPLSYQGSIDRKSSKIGNIPSLEDRNLTQILSSKNNWIIAISKTFGFIEYENQVVDQFNNDLDHFFKIGDKVAVSNIVCIDLNDKRKLIKDYFTVIDITGDFLYLQVPINFPVRRIERDSDEHLIFATKNVWLNGAFLNGIFKGVWTNGLFKGRPYLTKMIDSHWVNGRFDGGRFRGLTMSVYDDVIGSENVNQQILPSSVIQYFDFKDNNIGFSDSITLDNYLKYNSWMELNYFTSSMTNIHSGWTSWDDIFQIKKPKIEHNGYPTRDVLSSSSKFKNTYNDMSEDYSLGWKYEAYDEFIENPFFNYPINSTENFITGLFDPDVIGLTESFDINATYSIPGMYDFIKNNRWRTSVISPNFSGLTIAGWRAPFISSNTSVDNIDILKISSSTQSSKPFLLENDLTFKGRPNNKYTIIEFEMNHQPVNNSFKYPYLLNEPVAKLFTGDDLVQYISAVPDFIGHNQTNETIKREYFYGRPSLGMIMSQTLHFYDIIFGIYLGFTGSNPGLATGDIVYVSKRDSNQNSQINRFFTILGTSFSSTWGYLAEIGPFNPPYTPTPTGTDGGIVFLLKPYTTEFNYIKMYEVDAIPFFYYAGEDRINQAIQAPFSAIAPPIDYSDSDFSLIDNINITETIFETATNPVSVSSGGVTVKGTLLLEQASLGRNPGAVVVSSGGSSGTGIPPLPALPVSRRN